MDNVDDLKYEAVEAYLRRLGDDVDLSEEEYEDNDYLFDC